MVHLLFNRSAVQAGLLEDPFAKCFLPPRLHTCNKDPTINRGTYLRIRSIDDQLARFLASGPIQVLSLGSGFDTRFFKFKVNKRMKPHLWQIFIGSFKLA